MKNKFLFFVMLALIGLYVPAAYSQVTFNCSLVNDAFTAPNIYEFDIYIQSTGTTPFRLCAAQFDISYNTAILNGGKLTASEIYTTDTGGNIVTYSWSDPVVNYEPMNTTVGTGDLQIVSVAYGLRNSATIVTTTAPGYCMGRIRLTNSVGFAVAKPNLAFKFTGYSTIILAFLGGSGNNTTTDIAANGTFITSGLVNPALPVELTSFVSNVSGRQVNLNWETKTEVNTKLFEIERSLVSSKDASIKWASVGTVSAAGTSTSPIKYTYSDKNLQSGKYQYRLKMVDYDGSFKLSDIVESEITLPKNFELSQNYPNPFNPSTRINYSLPFDSKVILEVYNIAGERIGQIVNAEQSAGYYTINFSSSTLNRSIASGVYIYKINAVDNSTGNVYTSITKMMLLK